MEEEKFKAQRDVINALNILIVTEREHKGDREDQINLLIDEFSTYDTVIGTLINAFMNFVLFIAVSTNVHPDDLLVKLRDDLLKFLTEMEK